jgi:hypothetical protein
MGFAQDLLDEIGLETNPLVEKKEPSWSPQIEQEVEAELHIAIQQELEGNLSSNCAQRLIDTA